MTKVTKNQTDAMTVLVKTCLKNIFTETLRNGHLARSFAKAGTVNVEDLIVDEDVHSIEESMLYILVLIF